ncbi:MAG TPA: NrdH-redoxin, partial [Burkholderiales bacterium]|nr:NrdH-redoxin [Burkholderiales bacterium]
MLKLGVRNVPVVARGEQFVFGQNLEDVAEFVGLQGTGHTPLPPGELVDKWINALHAAQRYLRQLT